MRIDWYIVNDCFIVSLGSVIYKLRYFLYFIMYILVVNSFRLISGLGIIDIMLCNS